MFDWLKDPTAQTVVTGLASLFIPRLLSRFGFKVPGITPSFPTPQVPTVDAQLVEFERWLDAKDAGQLTLDVEDVRSLDRITARLAPKPAPTLPLGAPSGR